MDVEPQIRDSSFAYLLLVSDGGDGEFARLLLQ